MSHRLVLGLFGNASHAAQAARALRASGIPQPRVSIVARSHDEEGTVADLSGASPGSELEDSLPASRLGELSAHLLAAVALAVPGVGPIVADGPLAAGLGEAAGHAAGGLARTLERIGMTSGDADAWEARIEAGAILVGAHVDRPDAVAATACLREAGAEAVAEGVWADAD